MSSDAVRDFAVEIFERGEPAVGTVYAIAKTIWTGSAGVIPRLLIDRVIDDIEATDGPAAGELGRRLVAACQDGDELHADSLHYLLQWFDFFGGRRPLQVLVDAGLLPSRPTRLPPKRG